LTYGEGIDSPPDDAPGDGWGSLDNDLDDL
jgi:hypothetical protein